MRIALRVGIALVACGASGAVAGEAKKQGAIRVAAAEAVEPSQSVAGPVTKTARLSPAAKPARRAVAPSLVARIDLTRQRMHVTSNGKVVGRWKISSGKLGYETPPGRFRPKWASKMHYSRKYNNSPMPYSVFFNGGIATHGTTYTRRLGGAASHGCIRLQTANARKFYKLVHRHGYKRTRIIVTGRAKINRSVARRSTRKAHRSSRRNNFAAASKRRNAYQANVRRYSLNAYHRRQVSRYQQRVTRYYQSRRLVYPGDRY